MTSPVGDPIAILLAEHEQAERLFVATDAALARLAGGGDTAVDDALAAVDRLLVFLDGGLEVHIRKEEEPLFPRMKAALPADDRLVDEMVAEHDHIRSKRDGVRAALVLLQEQEHAEVREHRDRLRAAAGSVRAGRGDAAEVSAFRRTSLAALQTLRVHFQNEEELLFPLAPDLLTAEALAAAAREMAAIDAESDVRDAGPVEATIMLDDPHRALAALLASPEAERDGRTARTLAKVGALRVVLVALRAGGRIAEHHAPGPLLIQQVAGSAIVHAGGESRTLTAGACLVLPAQLSHAVEAREDCGLLLTIAAAD